MKPRVEAAIFDLDGVLLDTEPLYTIATETVFARYGRRYEPHHKRFVMGRSPLEGATWLIQALELPMTAQQYLDERQHHLERLFSKCPCVPGAATLVAALRARGIRLALATSSERSLFQLKTKEHSWFNAFEYVVCGDDPRLSRSKPAPDIFLLASAGLNISPESCVVFEDSAAGVQAAVAAGMRVIARLEAPTTATDLAQATQILTTYDELDIDRLLEG
jgi:pseudouridine-5'-monophosphatase